MPRHDWLKQPPVGRLEIAVLISIFIAGISIGLFVEQQLNLARQESAAREHYESTKRGTKPLGMTARAHTDPQIYRQEWREEQNLQAQEDMARWAKWLVFTFIVSVGVTAAGVFYVALSLEEIRETTRVAIAAVKAAQERSKADRAWMANVLVVPHRIRSRNGDLRAYGFHINWKNCGSTPALQTEVSINHLPFPSGTADSEMRFSRRRSAVANMAVVGPNVEVETDVREIPLIEMDALARGECRLCIYSRADYLDVNDARRFTECCMEIKILGPPMEILLEGYEPQFSYCAVGPHNRAT